MIVAADQASATGQHRSRDGLYDTTRYLPHTHNECAGAVDCQVVASPWRVVKAGRGLTVPVDCPPGKPNVWGWDTNQHEHLQAQLAGYTARGLTIAVRNVADRRGSIRIFLGCSAKRFAGASVMQSRVGAPTKVVLLSQRARRDDEPSKGAGP